MRRAARPVPMTWEQIMRDRIARGLEVDPATARPTPPRPAKNQARRTSRAADAGPRRVTIDGLEIDARDPRNATPCTAPRYTGLPPKSPAAAARARREAMAQCACRLCALALHPPLTFAEHRAFCGQIVDESMEREIFGAPRVLRAPPEPSRSELAAYRETLATEQLIHGPRGVTDPWSTAERDDRSSHWEWTGTMWRPIER